MSKLFGESFWFCLAFLSNLLLLKNTVFAAETTAAQVPIPDAQEPIAVNDGNLWQCKYKGCYQLPITHYPRSVPRYRQSLLI